MLKVEKPWYAHRKPEEITPVPWLHPSATSYLEEIIRPEFWVLEHGSGGSTLWFSRRVASVVSIEHDQKWRDKVREFAPANVTLLEAFGHTGQVFDLFLIDGLREERGDCLLKAHVFVKPGGWVVLDNANRPEYEAARRAFSDHAKLVERFNNNIPTKTQYIVTEFWRCE